MRNITIKELVTDAEGSYIYQTEHKDAAESYEYVLHESYYENFGNDSEAEETMLFAEIMFDTTDDNDVLASVYLGQQEVEVQLSRSLKNQNEVEALDERGFTGKIGSDLVYQMYPDNLYVVAKRNDLIL